MSFTIEKAHQFTYLTDQRREGRAREKQVERIGNNGDKFLQMLNFLQPHNKNSFQKISDVMAVNNELTAISACCLHCNEDRNAIVDHIDEEIIIVLAQTAQKAFDGIVGKWQFYTFAPEDISLLKELDMIETLLPYMARMSDEELHNELSKNVQIMHEAVRIIAKICSNLQIIIYPLSIWFKKIDLNVILNEAEKRGEKMYEKMIRSDSFPKIFEMIATQEQKKARCAKEAIMYLAMTANFANKDYFYAGLEVHGNYWRTGNLNNIDNKILPILWFHPVLTQHWGTWTLDHVDKKNKFSEYQKWLTKYHLNKTYAYIK